MVDPNMQITLEYPDVIKQGDRFVLSSIIKASTDQISNITLSVSSPELYSANNTFSVIKLAKGSTFGSNFELETKSDMPDGEFVANIQVIYFVKGMFDANPVKNTFVQAFHLNVQSNPILSFDIQAPNNVFSGEPFSIKGTVKNQGIKVQDVQISASSQDTNLEGRKALLLSSLDSGKSSDFEFLVNTPKDLDIQPHSNSCKRYIS